MINTRKHRTDTLHHLTHYPLLVLLAQPTPSYHDQTCLCSLRPAFHIQTDWLILELHCQPRTGVFQGIDFKLKIMLNCLQPLQRPRIYNDRRVFHPNINVLTCEFVSRLIKENILTADILNCQRVGLEGLIKDIMRVLVSPDCSFVADNRYNRKAAWHYSYNRSNYPSLIVQHCPLNLNKAVLGDYRHSHFSQLKTYKQERDIEVQEGYWNIECTRAKPVAMPSLALEMDEERGGFALRGIRCMGEEESGTEGSELGARSDL